MRVAASGGLRKQHMSDADLCKSSNGPTDNGFSSKTNRNLGNFHHHHHHHHGGEKDALLGPEVTSSSGTANGHPVAVQNGYHLELISEHVKGWTVNFFLVGFKFELCWVFALNKTILHSLKIKTKCEMIVEKKLFYQTFTETLHLNFLITKFCDQVWSLFFGHRGFILYRE